MKIFVDTNIFKYAAAHLPRLKPRWETYNWGGEEFRDVIHDDVYLNPNDNIKNNPKLAREVELIPEIVSLQKQENIEFFETIESMLETWGLPNMDSTTGRLFGANITQINAPVKYSRLIFGAGYDASKLQFEFLRSIESKRFKEIQKATGAFQGENLPNKNQLLDAFHLWCTEYANCDVFLTGEAIKLRGMMYRKKNFIYIPQVLLPSELLNLLDNRFTIKKIRKVKRWLRQRKLLPPIKFHTD